MLVLMAANATSFRERADGTTVVVAAETLGRSVRTMKSNPRFSLMIKLEIIANLLPTSFHVAEGTIGGKAIVRNRRTPFLVPVLTLNGLFALKKVHHA
jgi:hypothetical protein